MPETKENARLIFAASENCADLRYESGFSAPDPFLWFEVSGQRTVIVSPLEFSRAQKECRTGTEVICTEDVKTRFGLRNVPVSSASEQICAISRSLGVHHWQVPDNFPLGLAQKLTKRRIRLSTLNPFSPQRAIKTEAEIAAIQEAVQLAEIGLQCAENILRQSRIGKDNLLFWQNEILTAEILRGEIDAEIARAGGIAQGTICAPGRQGADPHQVGTGAIHAHEPIALDIFPRSKRSGYHGDLTRTWVKGKASDYVWRAFKAVQQAQKNALQALKPGVSGKDIHQGVVDLFKERGFETVMGGGVTPRGFFHSTGHGLGLEVHEAPSLSLRNEAPLQTGHVVTVEPGLYYPEWGGVRLEDVAVLTDTGCRNLTKAPIFLEIP
ncbi:MAG: aminopeptidase P family protein [Lentisphaerae bacterium]|nr:aminopeptidase P family protein [Lentisphaerota bacterium]